MQDLILNTITFFMILLIGLIFCLKISSTPLRLNQINPADYEVNYYMLGEGVGSIQK